MYEKKVTQCLLASLYFFSSITDNKTPSPLGKVIQEFLPLPITNTLVILVAKVEP